MTCTLAAFVIPFYGDHKNAARYLGETIEGLFAQTDEDWIAVVIDDASPNQSACHSLSNIEARFSPKIEILRQETNRGPAIGRNRGIMWAAAHECPFILFNDADDISHPDRLRVVREVFEQSPTVDLVYSTAHVIDEHGQLIQRDELASPSTKAMLDALQATPVEGYNAWITIGTITGFTCLPSSTAVRTAIACQCLFPDERVADDSFTWMHIAARGGEFRYVSSIPSLYRVPTYTDGTSHRTRIGKRKFCEEEVRVDTAGFLNALSIAVERGTIAIEEVETLQDKFFQRVAETMMKEGEFDLAQRIDRGRRTCS